MFEDDFDYGCLDIDIDNDFKDIPCTDNTKESISKRKRKKVDDEVKRVKLQYETSDNIIQHKLVPESSSDIFNLPNRVLKRKFPGPAGLLPEKNSNDKFNLPLDESVKYEEDESTVFPLLSQQTCEIYKEGPWKEMKEDLQIDNEEHIVNKFNIKWIKKNKSKYSSSYKAPFLAAILQNLDIIDGKIPTINVILKDPTGSIPGTILHSLYEEYSTYFRIGSVLVLKQFGVFTSGFNKFCLIITPKNLLTIYYPEVAKKLLTNNIETCVSGDATVKKIVIQNYNLREMLQYYEDIMASHISQCDRFRNNNMSESRSVYDITEITDIGSAIKSSNKMSINTSSGTYEYIRAINERELSSTSAEGECPGSRTKIFRFKQLNCNSSKVTEGNNSTDIIQKQTSYGYSTSNTNTSFKESNHTSVKPSKTLEESSETIKEMLDDIDINSFLGDF